MRSPFRLVIPILILFVAFGVSTADPVPFVEHTISSIHDNAHGVSAADIDGDGDMDVVAHWGPSGNRLAWFESDGASPPNFSEHFVASDTWYEESAPADIDGDGDVDIVAATVAGTGLRWFENDGASPPVFTARSIDTLGNYRSLYLVDMDGDMDVDVVAGTDSVGTGELYWYENLGGVPATFLRHTVPNSKTDYFGVFAGDVDGDGDTDIVAGCEQAGPGVVWYESDGLNPPAFTEWVLSGYKARHVHGGDLDGDGDLDIVAPSVQNDDIVWYENGGGASPSFTQHTLVAYANNASTVFVIDLDSDGDRDVLYAAAGDDEFGWHENTGGTPPVFVKHIIVDTSLHASTVAAADVDGDLDVDVLGAAQTADTIAWFENLTPVPVTIETTIAFFEQTVADGTLQGTGALPALAWRRLERMRRMLNRADRFLGLGIERAACRVLWRAYRAVDGRPWPIDLVEGESAAGLAEMILEVREPLDCRFGVSAPLEESNVPGGPVAFEFAAGQ